jgi:protein involved in polysaccharide export with SLBB domain
LSFIWFAPACFLVSCAVTPPREVNEKYTAVIAQRHDHYVLKDGDTITVKLYNRAGDLNQSGVLVLPDGRSDLFYMDNQLLSGKTVAEMEADLKAHIAGEVLNPEVSIQVTPKGEKIYMVGQFERPGTIDLTTKMTLQQAISATGGIKVTGDSDWALLRRPFGNPRHPDLFRIDLNDESEEIFLLPEDQIVLQRTFVAGLQNYLREYIFGLLPTSTALPYASFAAF